MATSTAYSFGFQCAGAIVEQLRSSLCAPYQRRRPSLPSFGYICTYVPEEIIHAVANDNGLVQVLSSRAGFDISVPEWPEYVCALGAALIAAARSQ